MIQLLLFFTCLSIIADEPQDVWPAFLGQGQHPVNAQVVPTRWSPNENIAWKVQLAGKGQHLGNYWLAEPSKPKSFDNSVGMNRNNLEKWLDTGAYLTGHSDIVALMVLEHQVEAFNLLTHANFVTQHATWECLQSIAAGRDRGEAERTAHERIRNAVRPLVHYMLFAQEAKLSAPISGMSGFQKDFANVVGHPGANTIRQFDLKDRLFTTRLSYLVYSPALAEQQTALHDSLSTELWAATGDNYESAKLLDLSDEDRKAIRTILEASPPAWFRVNN